MSLLKQNNVMQKSTKNKITKVYLISKKYFKGIKNLLDSLI